jgi:Cu+-exporting ATPase
MAVEPATAEYRSSRGGVTYHFCSAGCKASFEKEPDKYLARGKGAA